jgi:hypothetical protein
VISVGMALSFLRMILGWFDRTLADPVMRERINDGSDRFFAYEEEHLGELDVDNPGRVEFRPPKPLAPPTERR